MDVFGVHGFIDISVDECLEGVEVVADGRCDAVLRREVDDLVEVAAVDAAVRPEPAAPASLAVPAVVVDTVTAVTAAVVPTAAAATDVVLVRVAKGIRRVRRWAEATRPVRGVSDDLCQKYNIDAVDVVRQSFSAY